VPDLGAAQVNAVRRALTVCRSNLFNFRLHVQSRFLRKFGANAPCGRWLTFGKCGCPAPRFQHTHYARNTFPAFRG